MKIEDAKTAIIDEWKRFDAKWENGIGFKQEKIRFVNYIYENNKELLCFETEYGIMDQILSSQKIEVDNWISEFEESSSL